MKYVSEDFKILSKNIRQQKIKLSILDDNELTVRDVHMMPVNMFNSMSIKRLKEKKQVVAKELVYSFEGQLFKTIMKQIELTVKNANEIKDKKLNFKYGLFVNNEFEYVDLGSFFIKDIEDDKKKDELTVTGYDKMIHFMKTFKQADLKLTYPCKMSQLVQKMCEVCNVESYSLDFYNADLIVDDDFFTNQELTYRDVLEKVTQATLTTAFIKNDKLYFAKIENVAVQKLDKSYISNLIIKEKFGPVNSLIIARGDVEDNLEARDDISISRDGKCEIRFDENEFIQYTNRKDIIDDMFEQIKGFEYYSFEGSDLGVMWLEPCDCIELSDREGNSYKSFYLSAHITINTGIVCSISADILEETNTEYKVTTKEEKKYLKVERLAKKNKGIIQDLIEENSEHEQKMTEVLQTVDTITQKVENEIDLTRIASGTKKITLENCAEGNLLELHIYGNNGVFQEDSLIKITRQVEDEEGNVTVVEEIIDLNITEVLKQKQEVFDEYVLSNDKAKIIRRIGVLENGETYILQKEQIEDLGDFSIKLNKGTNTIEIVNYTANMRARYAVINGLTDKLASKVEVKTEIKQASYDINLTLNKKIDKENIIAAINMAVLKLKGEDVSEKEVEKTVIQLIANILEIDTDNYKLSKNGYMKALAGEIAGWTFTQNYFYKNYKIDDESYQCGLYSSDNANDIFLYAGVKVPGYLREANTYITKNGLVVAKWFRVNGENGYFYVDHANGNKALVFSNNGINKYLNNGNRWSYQGIVYRNSVPSTEGVFFYDAQGFEFVDGLHGNATVFKIGYNTEGCICNYGLHVYGALDYLDNDTNLIQNSGRNVEYAITHISPQNLTGGGINVILRNGTIFSVLNSTSDRRLKENIKDTEVKSALVSIRKFIFYSFDWIADKKHQEIGVMAQDLEKINKNLVIKVKQGDSSKYKYLYQLNSDELQMYGLKAIQELDEEVEKLKKENTLLKNQVETQQKTIEFLLEKLKCKEELEEYLKGGTNA